MPRSNGQDPKVLYSPQGPIVNIPDDGDDYEVRTQTTSPDGTPQGGDGGASPQSHSNRRDQDTPRRNTPQQAQHKQARNDNRQPDAQNARKLQGKKGRRPQGGKNNLSDGVRGQGQKGCPGRRRPNQKNPQQQGKNGAQSGDGKKGAGAQDKTPQQQQGDGKKNGSQNGEQPRTPGAPQQVGAKNAGNPRAMPKAGGDGAQTQAALTQPSPGSRTAKAPQGRRPGAGQNRSATSSRSASRTGSGGRKSAKTPKDKLRAKAKGTIQGKSDIARVARKVKQVIRHAIRAARAAFHILLNPAFWIALGITLAIVIITIIVLSVSQLLGKTDNANGCSGIGGDDSGGGNLPTAVDTGHSDADAQKNATAIANWLTSTNFAFLGNHPMSKKQAAAFIGNAYQESQINPALTQGNERTNKISNETVISWGGDGNEGHAVGLWQWDVSGRLALAHYAQKAGKPWYDMGVQLQFAKAQLDGTNKEDGVDYGAKLLAAGFNDPSKSVDELTGMVNEVWEISGDRPSICASHHTCDRNQARINYAKKFLGYYKGGESIQTGGSCLMEDNGVDASSAVKAAISMAYPTLKESNMKPGDPDGSQSAKQAYLDGKKQAMEKTGQDGQANLYASCDRFVATVMRLTGVDTKIPWGNTAAQYKYLKSSPQWQMYTSKSQAKPGDIWVTKGDGHIVIYLGQYQGKDSTASASYMQRVAGIGPATTWSDSLVDSEGRQYAGFHHVGS